MTPWRGACRRPGLFLHRELVSVYTCGHADRPLVLCLSALPGGRIRRCRFSPSGRPAAADCRRRSDMCADLPPGRRLVNEETGLAGLLALAAVWLLHLLQRRPDDGDVLYCLASSFLST